MPRKLFNIVIDGGPGNRYWNPAAYEFAVYKVIGLMIQTITGRIVFLELTFDRSKTIMIRPRPYLKKGLASAWVHKKSRNEVNVYYTPADWREPSSILIHEFSHAIAHLQGFLCWERKKLHDGWFDTNGEVIAIAIANLHRLDLGMNISRISHRTLPDGGMDWKRPSVAKEYFDKNRKIFLEMKHIRPRLYSRLQTVRPLGFKQHEFNPFYSSTLPVKDPIELFQPP